MKIVRASVENFKRLEVVEITPDGAVVEITGANEQGKSSVLDAIEAALAGKRHAPAEPIRRGAEEEGARVVLDLGDLLVERRWTATSDRLVVKSPEGATFPRGQAKLDGLVGGLAFDPLAFMGLKPTEQRETLLGVIGVDLEGFENRRRTAYDERRAAGRQLRAAQARLDGASRPAEGTPDEEVSIAEVTNRLREAIGKKDLNDAKRRRAAEKAAESRKLAGEYGAAVGEVRWLEKQLEAAREKAEHLKADKTKAMKAASRAKTAADKLVDPDIAAIQAEITVADNTNAEVRKAKARADLAFEVERLTIEVGEHQAALDEIAEEKRSTLESADMPVDGLEITDDGVAFEGLPLDQAAMSRRVRVCTAIGAALNPKLRIALVRSGNDLDADSLAAFYSYCAEAGLQAWVERIEPTTEGAVVIEAGRVAGAEEGGSS